MRKYFAVFLIFVFVLSLAGCNSHQPNTQDTPSTSSVTESILDHLIEEDGEQYLILPISKKRVRVTSSHMQYLDEIDLNLLRTAEEKSGKTLRNIQITKATSIWETGTVIYPCVQK